jgi:hypothetical protein
MLMAAVALFAATPEADACIGDYVFRAPKDEVSVGVRVRRGPDLVELLFSDQGTVRATNVTWSASGLVAIEDSKSYVVLVCHAGAATLVLPAEEYSPARLYPLRAVKGSLWEVGAREGWLTPGD